MRLLMFFAAEFQRTIPQRQTGDTGRSRLAARLHASDRPHFWLTFSHAQIESGKVVSEAVGNALEWVVFLLHDRTSKRFGLRRFRLQQHNSG
jgi:hypothetical protein